MKTQFSFQSALMSGFAATIAMTAFTYMAPIMGLEMNIPKMLAMTMGAPLFAGWLAHFMIGSVLAVGFASVFLSSFKKLPGLKSGVLYGVFPWLLAQLMVMPMMMVMNGGSFASGLFSGSLMMAMASLVGHLIYGGVLGLVYKPEIQTSKAVA